MKKVRIGLTGAMGSGKSTAGRLLEACGFHRIDTDAVVRQLLVADAEVAQAVRTHFGDAVFKADGSLDRGALGQRVFAAEADLRALESILHPRVRSTWIQALDAAPQWPWCVEIPLLFEKKLEKHFDYTLCLSASEAVCLARLAAKGFSPEDARARMARQLSLDEKIRRADYILSNNGSLEFLAAQIERLAHLLNVSPEVN